MTENNDKPKDQVDELDEVAKVNLQKEQLLEERFSKIEQQVNQGPSVAKIMSVPGVRELIEAQSNGRKIKLVDETEQATPSDPLEGVDFENMDSRGVVKLMLGMLPKMVNEVVKQNVAPINDQVGRIRGHLAKSVEKEVNDQVEEARERFPDFDQVKPQILALSNENPGLTVDELYLLAKRRLTKKKGVRRSEVESEKPNNEGSPGRKTNRLADDEEERELGRREPMGHGKSGFQSALRRALENNLFKPEG